MRSNILAIVSSPRELGKVVGAAVGVAVAAKYILLGAVAFLDVIIELMKQALTFLGN